MNKKRGKGRPELPVEQRMTNRGVRMLPEQWAKFDLIGGAKWLRAKVNQAKVK